MARQKYIVNKINIKMRIKLIRGLLVFTIILALNLVSFAQNFEGSISYKVVTPNPFPEQISEEDHQKMLKETFGERGYMLQKYFYKGSDYMSEIEAGEAVGYMTYNQADGLLYSWQKGAKNAVTLDSKKSMDEFVEIIDLDEKETILDIPCSSILVKSKIGEITVWYNKDHFKMDAALFADHKYGHWNEILKKIGCLPLKMEMKGMMGHVFQTAIEFKEETVEDSKFELPNFEEVTANPMN